MELHCRVWQQPTSALCAGGCASMPQLRSDGGRSCSNWRGPLAGGASSIAAGPKPEGRQGRSGGIARDSVRACRAARLCGFLPSGIGLAGGGDIAGII